VNAMVKILVTGNRALEMGTVDIRVVESKAIQTIRVETLAVDMGDSLI